MKIIQVAPFDETVPPQKYGGTELVIFNLTEELVRRGHTVYLIAAGDSKTSAQILPVFPRALRNEDTAKNPEIKKVLKSIGTNRVIEYLKNIEADIIHNHLGWRVLASASLIKTPIITTLHGPLDAESQHSNYSNFKKANYVSISDSQREPLPDLNYISTVYNGINIKKFDFSEKGGRYLAFLGRMSPEKGPIEAILAAKKSGLKLKMAAKVDPVDKIFFEKEVAPLIDGEQIEFLGEVNHEGKVKLLKNAKALLCPIQWREPFGLFFIEAMATGTPVIAFNRGSVPEVVEDKKTGFIVKNVEEMIEAVAKIDKIDRNKCRERVEKYFTAEKMADGYEKAYQKVIA